MKLKLLAGAAVAGMFAAAGAYAQPADSGWYGAIDVGAHQAQPLDTTSQFNEPGQIFGHPPGPFGPPANLTVFTNDNFAGFARIGYKINPHVRIELEAGYRPANIHSVLERHFLGRPPGSIESVCQFHSVPIGSACPAPAGNNDVWTAMGNLLVDLLPNSSIDPFIGGGIGAAHVRLVMNGRMNNSPFLQDMVVNSAQNVFAYQGIFGLAIKINDQLNLDLTYRYLETQTTRWQSHEFADFQLGNLEGRYRDSSATAGLRYLLAPKRL